MNDQQNKNYSERKKISQTIGKTSHVIESVVYVRCIQIR